MQSIKAGYRAFNGYTFTSAMAALYNRTCEETERAVRLAGSNPSPMAAASVERARDNQARMFKSIIEDSYEVYGLYQVTMNDGFKVKVNARGLQSAYESLMNAKVIHAPMSSISKCELVKQLTVVSPRL